MYASNNIPGVQNTQIGGHIGITYLKRVILQIKNSKHGVDVYLKSYVMTDFIPDYIDW